MNSQAFLKQNNSALFIDRDGVINKLRENDYVKQSSEFILLPEVIPALQILRPLFRYMFIVTNQQGIGKKLMVETIDHIHDYFLSLLPVSLHPNQIYYCPHLKEEACVCRKPLNGMALMAKNDYPDLNLSNSLMVGDSLSDMEFAKNSGMVPFLISKTESLEYQSFGTILDFAQFIGKK